jgi:3-deoxy-D-manno-octulosonic-acid transferase
VTGSVKFDLEGTAAPERRSEFEAMLLAFGAGRPVVLGASTHAGEEVLIARALREVPGALAVLLPRHAERRRAVADDLARAGFEVVLRSEFAPPSDRADAVFVVDSTGELRDWTAHADLVVIGKSFLARGGQNPAEAIAAKVPVICGSHMENFDPLIGQLRAAGAVRTVERPEELGGAIVDLLGSARDRKAMVQEAGRILARHGGATGRTVELFRALASR